MQQLTFIGTLHGMTPKEELEEIIVQYKPGQLLIEMVQQDIDKETVDSYPQEMIDAYNWAKAHNIPVFGFDSKIDVLIKGKTKKDEEKLSEEQDEIINKHNWKDFNKEKYDKLLNTKSWYSLVDREKLVKRQEEMYANILNKALKDGRVVIITGSGHISFFKKKFPKAEFPLS